MNFLDGMMIRFESQQNSAELLLAQNGGQDESAATTCQVRSMA
jgi:hypothetical protein